MFICIDNVKLVFTCLHSTKSCQINICIDIFKINWVNRSLLPVI